MNKDAIHIKKNPYILAIETSCDETAISYMEDTHALSHHVHSQASLHAEFGGVFPNLAKREHTTNLVPVLSLVFKDIFDISFIDSGDMPNIDADTMAKVEALLSREHDLAPHLIKYINSIPSEKFEEIKNSLDAVAVTFGPGLEPALWVGISFAKALAVIFNTALFPINHMEGHIASVLAGTESEIEFPAIALLISGGHTELVHVSSWHEYSIMGQTVDDAVGEAYDKAARVLGLPYPGGPEISKLASTYDGSIHKGIFTLPRPMIHSKDFNFSFSGLKTAVLYAVRDILKTEREDSTKLSDIEKVALAYEFEAAVIDVLISKTKKAVLEIGAKSILIGGGVISNTKIRKAFEVLAKDLEVDLFLPEKTLTTDNAAMIGIVAALQFSNGKTGFAIDSPEFADLKANGNLSF